LESPFWLIVSPLLGRVTWQQQIEPDLSHEICNANLSMADLTAAVLNETQMSGSNLKNARMVGADLSRLICPNAI
jgi:uncharacterized protein YjbI with pentapeptide repeats